MRKLIYQTHILLGVFVSIPVLLWAVSGLLYAWPNTVEGGSVEKIDTARVLVSPAFLFRLETPVAGGEAQ